MQQKEQLWRVSIVSQVVGVMLEALENADERVKTKRLLMKVTRFSDEQVMASGTNAGMYWTKKLKNITWG